MNFIIDDYFNDQKINLFNPEFVYYGISYDSDKTFNVWIILYYPKVLHEIGEESPDYKKYSRL